LIDAASYQISKSPNRGIDEKRKRKGQKPSILALLNYLFIIYITNGDYKNSIDTVSSSFCLRKRDM
jgi:hypothetical protein